MAEDYLVTLEKELKAKRKRLADAIASDAFLNEGGGQIALDVLDTQVTQLLAKITSTKGPVSYEDYLNAHGGITALQGFRSEMAGNSKEAGSLNKEVEIINEQVQSFTEDRAQQ